MRKNDVHVDPTHITSQVHHFLSFIFDNIRSVAFDIKLCPRDIATQSLLLAERYQGNAKGKKKI